MNFGMKYLMNQEEWLLAEFRDVQQEIKFCEDCLTKAYEKQHELRDALNDIRNAISVLARYDEKESNNG